MRFGSSGYFQCFLIFQLPISPHTPHSHTFARNDTSLRPSRAPILENTRNLFVRPFLSTWAGRKAKRSDIFEKKKYISLFGGPFGLSCAESWFGFGFVSMKILLVTRSSPPHTEAWIKENGYILARPQVIQKLNHCERRRCEQRKV